MADDNKAQIILSATDKTKAAFDSAKKSLKELGDKADSIGSNFGTIGAAITAAFAGASLKGVIDAGDELNKLSQRTGITVESLSVLKYAGDLANVGIEDLAIGIKKLAVNMADAAGGGKEAQTVFQTLGVAFKSANGGLRATDDILAEIADKFSTFEDGPAKAALAVAVFGKQGDKLIPFLNQGSAGLAQMREEAEKFGIVISGDFAKQAEQFNDNLTKINKTFEAQKILVANDILPLLNQLSEAFLTTRESGEKVSLVGEAIRTALEAIAVVGANVMFVFRGVGREIGAWAAQLGALASGNLSGFSAISDAVKADGERARKELDDFEERVLRVGKHNPIFDSFAKTAYSFGGGGNTKTAAPVIPKGIADAVNQYDQLIARIKERGAAEQQQLNLGRELNEGEKFGLDIVSKLADAHNKLTDAQKRNAAAELEQVLGLAKANDERKRQAEADKATSEAAQQHIQDLLKERDARLQSNKTLADSIEEIGLTADKLDALTIKRLEATKAQEEANLATARANEASEAELTVMQQNIDLLERQINLRRADKAARDRESNNPLRGAERALDDFVDTAKKTGDAVESLTNRTLRGLEDGLTGLLTGQKTGFKQLIDDIIAEVTRLLVVRPLIASIVSSLQGLGAGGGGAISGAALGDMFGFEGMFAKGGTLGAGKWGIAGENGQPEIVKGPAQIMPLADAAGQATQQINVHNYFTVSGAIDRRSEAQIAAQAGAGVQRALARNA